jgi:predicted  nucleic acid-binding Zn-ribbon protein
MDLTNLTEEELYSLVANIKSKVETELNRRAQIERDKLTNSLHINKVNTELALLKEKQALTTMPYGIRKLQVEIDELEYKLEGLQEQLENTHPPVNLYSGPRAY